MTQRVSSLGSAMQAIHMWNTDGGLPAVDPYTYSTDADVVAGACLGIGPLLHVHPFRARPCVRTCHSAALVWSDLLEFLLN